MFKLCICVLIFSAAAYTAAGQEYDPAYDDYNYADEETKASWSRGREHPLDEGYDEEYTGDYGDDDDGPYGDVIGIPVDDHDDGDVEVGVHSNNTEEAEAVQASIGRVAKHEYSAEVPPDYQFEDNRSDAKEENALENVKVAPHENDNLISLDELRDALLKNNNENKPKFEDKVLDSADVADTAQNIENSQIEEDIEENIDHEVDDALFENNNENEPNFEDKVLDSADVADTAQSIENSQIEEGIEENIDHEVDDALFENNNENEPNFEDKVLDSADVADTAQNIENSQIEEDLLENADHEVDDALFENNNKNEHILGNWVNINNKVIDHISLDADEEDKVLDFADAADIAQSIENSQIVEGIPEYIKNEEGNNDQEINDALLKNNNENEPHFEDKDSADAADIKQSIESSSYDEGYDENNHIYIDADENKDQNEDTLTETVVNVSPVLKLENDTVVSAEKNKDTSQKEENYLNIDVIVHGNANATDIAQSIESSSYEEDYDEDLFSFGDYKLKNSDHIYKGADENKDQKEDILTENIVKESPVLKLGNDTVGRTDEHKDTSQKEENTLYVDDVAKWLELNSGEISDKKVEYINKLFKELTDQLNREEDEDSDYANYSDDSDESKAEGDKVKYLLDILLEKLKTPDSIETGIFNDKDASTSQEKTDGEIVDDLKNVDKSVEVVVEQVIDEKATEQASETTFPTMDVKDLPSEAFDQLMVQFTAFNADEIDTDISDKKVEYINKLYKKLTDQLNREEDEDTGYANYSDDSLPNPDNINADEPKAEGDKVKDPLDILLEKPKTPDSIETGIFNDKDASISQEKTDEEIVDDLKNVDKSVEVVVEQVIDEKATEQASETITFPTMDVKDLPPEAFDQLMVQFTAFNADEIDTEIKKDGEVISYNLTAGEDLEVTSPNFPGAYPTNNIMEFYVTNLGPGIEFNITDLHIRGAMGDYLLVKIPDVHVEKGVVFTYHLTEHRAYRLMGVHRVFVRFVAKQGLNSLSGFRMTFRNVETTLWSPKDEEEDIPTPAPLLPKPPATLTVHLGGVSVSEFQFMKEEFTRLLADMATMYINANGIEEGLNSTSEVTQITTVSSCNVNWEDFNNCVRVTFGVPLVYEDGISRLSEEELKTMWETYVGQDPFAQRLSSMGIGLFQTPNESRVQMTWMMLGISVMFSAVLLAFALWRYSCFESYTKMKKTFSETDSTRDKKRGLDLYPTPHQTLPPLYAENDEKWAAKYEESTRVDMGGFTNRSFARDDEILDIDSDEDVNRRRDGFATDV